MKSDTKAHLLSMIEAKLQGFTNILAVVRLGGGGRGTLSYRGELGHVLYCTSTHEVGMLEHSLPKESILSY